MLTYADVRMLTQLQNQNQNLLRIKEEMAAGGDMAHVEQATLSYMYMCARTYIYLYIYKMAAGYVCVCMCVHVCVHKCTYIYIYFR